MLTSTDGEPMTLVIILLVLAVLIGAVSLLISGLKWLLIIAAALIIASALSNFVSRRSKA